MRGYGLDHRRFRFDLKFPRSLSHLRHKPYLICRTALDSLYARIVVSEKNGKVRHRLTRLKDTPHFAYLGGDVDRYRKYLERFGPFVGYGVEHSIEDFERLERSPAGYLEGEHASEFIVCEKVKTLLGVRNVILDGVHRGCLLLHQGVREVPVPFLFDRLPQNTSQFTRYLEDYRDDFPEWYTPVEVGGRVIHERTYPDFRERPEFLNNRERGKSRWDYIIARNLPDVRGKSVCDIGCNVGLFSMYLRQAGAAKVVGYDRSADAVQPSNPSLSRQSVVQQAWFVRNLFVLAGNEGMDGVEFHECDFNIFDFSSLRFDLFFSCCVLYHFGPRFEEIVRTISSRIPEVFLQTNLGHRQEGLAEYASVEYHEALLRRYGYRVRVNAPPGYAYPTVYGWK